MIKVLLAVVFFLFTLEARENPFFPAKGEKDIPFTSNESQNIQALKRATIALPPQARVLKKVTIEYKNLDGSIESKSIELENAVDWHLPIFISQSYTEQKTKSRAKKKQVFKKVASVKFATFFTNAKTLKIITNDTMLRNFLLVQPHRIVIDFQRDASFKSYVKDLPKNIFTQIRVGNHSNYYRVVVELDGYYKYTMKKIKDGYIFELM